MHHPTDRTVHIMATVSQVVEHWLEQVVTPVMRKEGRKCFI